MARRERDPRRDGGGRPAPVRGDAEQRAALVSRLATEQPFNGFVFWPEHQTVGQAVRFGRDVVPLVRDAATCAPTSWGFVLPPGPIR